MIEPAMTPEEWAAALNPGGDVDMVRGDLRLWRHDEGEPFPVEVGIRSVDIMNGERVAGISHVLGKDLHALAALALHGQPFGFTWEDVDALRYDAEQARRLAVLHAGRWYGDMHELEVRLSSIADRIAALLPPRDEADR